MSQPTTIAEHELIRIQEEGPFDAHTYSFMAPFLPGKKTPEWSCNSIATTSKNHEPHIVHEYLVSPEAQAYIIATADMHEAGTPDNRFTSMRLWEMVVDFFLAAGGKPDELRFLGVNWIVNEAARKAMTMEFVEAQPVRDVIFDGEKAQVITLVGMRKYINPFIRCASRVAEALGKAAGREIVLKAVHLVRTEIYTHHIVCEFEQKELVVVAEDGPPVPVAILSADNSAPVKRSFSKKGRDATKRTSSHLIRRKD